MHRPGRHRVVPAGILIIGLLIAAGIYWNAVAAEANPLGDPEDSKQYLREMQVYGGTANVLAGELREGFGSLWHGKRLAFTVAFLTIVSAGAGRFVTRRLPAPGEAEAGSGP